MPPRRVAVIGAGQSRFGDRPESHKALFAEALDAALWSVPGYGPPSGAAQDEVPRFVRDRIEEAWIGSLGFGGAQLGNAAALLLEHVGLRGIPSRRVENACASSGFALRDAYLAVASGTVDVALAGGLEKMNDLSGAHKRYWLGVSGDTEWERLAGLTFPGVYALMADRHMHEYGTTKAQLAAVAVKNHANGALNPKAQFQKAITLEKAMSGPMVSDPLGLFDCCSTTDGASAVVLADEKTALALTDDPVWILGSGAATDHLAVHDRPSMTELRATRKALGSAMRDAEACGHKVTVRDLDVAEVHDCFTIAEILAVEDLGLCPKGEGGSYTERGATGRERREGPAVNTSGGLKAKGHPLGATGTGQIVEVFQQLSGTAGPRQVQGAGLGLAHNVGGSGATCAVHLLARGSAL